MSDNDCANLKIDSKPKYRCPVCGLETINDTISFSHAGECDGPYCVHCFAKWINSNVPVLILLGEEQDS